MTTLTTKTTMPRKSEKTEIQAESNPEPKHNPDPAPLDKPEPAPSPFEAEDPKKTDTGAERKPDSWVDRDSGVDWDRNGQYVDPETGEVFTQQVDYGNPNDYADPYQPTNSVKGADFTDIFGHTNIVGAYDHSVKGSDRLVGNVHTEITAEVDRQGRKTVKVDRNYYKTPRGRLVSGRKILKGLGNLY